MTSLPYVTKMESHDLISPLVDLWFKWFKEEGINPAFRSIMFWFVVWDESSAAETGGFWYINKFWVHVCCETKESGTIEAFQLLLTCSERSVWTRSAAYTPFISRFLLSCSVSLSELQFLYSYFENTFNMNPKPRPDSSTILFLHIYLSYCSSQNKKFYYRLSSHYLIVT